MLSISGNDFAIEPITAEKAEFLHPAEEPIIKAKMIRINQGAGIKNNTRDTVVKSNDK